MADLDVIKPSYDALNAVARSVDALVYVVGLIPDDDEHHALFSLLADRLDEDMGWLRREVMKLWPEQNDED